MKPQPHLFQSQAAALRSVIAHVQEREVTRCLLTFGSIATGDGTADSDLDLIFILEEPRSQGHAPYMPLDVKSTHVDLNLLTPEELSDRLGDPNWHYRLGSARILKGQISPDPAAVLWIDALQTWITSREARLYRLQSLRRDLMQLLQVHSRVPKYAEGLNNHIVAETMSLTLQATVELAGRLPFSQRNVLRQFRDSTDDDSLLDYWPLPLHQSDRIASGLDELWNDFKRLIQEARRILIAEVPELQAAYQDLLLVVDLSRYVRVVEEIRRLYQLNGWRGESNPALMKLTRGTVERASGIPGILSVTRAQVLSSLPQINDF
jgi:predicted nucleotidyltransferase